MRKLLQAFLLVLFSRAAMAQGNTLELYDQASPTPHVYTWQMPANLGVDQTITGPILPLSGEKIMTGTIFLNGGYGHGVNVNLGSNIEADSDSGASHQSATNCTQPPVWSSGTTYALGDVVSFSGTTYESLIGSNVNNQPNTSPADWVAACIDDRTRFDWFGMEGDFVRIKGKGANAIGDYFDWTRFGPTAALPPHQVNFVDSSFNPIIHIDEGAGLTKTNFDFSGTVRLGLNSTVDVGFARAGTNAVEVNNGTQVGSGGAYGNLWAGAVQANTFRINNGSDYFDLLNNTLGTHRLQLRDSSSNVLMDYVGASAQFTFTGSVIATSALQANTVRINNGSDYFDWLNNTLGTHHFQIRDSSSNVLLDYATASTPAAGVFNFTGGVFASVEAQAPTFRINNGSDYFDILNNTLGTHRFQIRDSSSNTILDYQSGATWNVNGNFAFTAGISSTLTIQSFATGGSVGLQVNGGAFQVLGNGTVGAANYNVGSPGTYQFDGVGGIRKSGGILQWSNDGSTWNTFAAAGGGVTSVAGTGNQVLVNGTAGSAQTGTLTLTLPQNIDTSAVPRFGGLLLNQANDSSGYDLQVNGGIEQTCTGCNILSKGFSSNAIYANSGGVTSHTGFWIEGTQVINASGQWVGTGVVTSITNGGNVTLFGSTGNVVISIPQSVATSAVPSFSGILINTFNSGSGYNLQTSNIEVKSGGNLLLDNSGSNNINMPNGGGITISGSAGVTGTFTNVFGTSGTLVLKGGIIVGIS